MNRLTMTLKATSIGQALLRAAKRRVIHEYSEFLEKPTGARALVAYLSWPLLPPRGLRDRTEFSNRGLAQEIPRVLNELGYAVDVVNFDNESWIPRNQYDLVVGHGGGNFVRLAELVGPKPVKIYFATGMYWKEANRREAERILELAERTGHLLPPDRAVDSDEEAANRVADAIICLGNETAAKSYASFSCVHRVNNAAFPVDDVAHLLDKRFESARREFLFFSGPGSVHKGLDRLLEAFEGTDLALHVCQTISGRFARAYRRHLTGLPNIVVHGPVPMRGAQYRSLVSRCGWVIHPTASEGQPGSVIECMAHGLIPIIPAAANMDVDDYGVLLPDCRISTLRGICLDLSSQDPGAIRTRAQRVLEAVETRYTPEAFRAAFRNAVMRVREHVRSLASAAVLTRHFIVETEFSRGSSPGRHIDTPR